MFLTAIHDLWAHLSGQLPDIIMSGDTDRTDSTPVNGSSVSSDPSRTKSPSEPSPIAFTYKNADLYTATEIAKLKKRGFVAAIDVGTTSARFIIFATESSDPIVCAQKELANLHPQPG